PLSSPERGPPPLPSPERVPPPPTPEPGSPRWLPPESPSAAPQEREPIPPPPPPPQPAKSIFEAVWAGEADGAPRPWTRESAHPVATHGIEREVMPPPPVSEPEPTPWEAPPVVPPKPVAPPEPEVEIFKSGVIDGMAYTLYTDGSIEAELAHGTVKFAS